MRRLIFGSCEPQRLYQQLDPTEPSEDEFENVVLAALICLYPSYSCFKFSGTFQMEDRGWRPDLAMVAKDLSHWFVVEVELTSHSFEGHVLPQVSAFKFGEYHQDCVSQLTKRMKLDQSTVEAFLQTSVRHVAVIANQYDRDWEVSLKALQIQFATASMYANVSGERAVELDGNLIPNEEYLGIGKYSALDRSIVATSRIQLADGHQRIYDLNGHDADWHVHTNGNLVWITRSKGRPTIEDGLSIQIMRTSDGSLRLRKAKPNAS